MQASIDIDSLSTRESDCSRMKCYYKDAQTGITHDIHASFIKWSTDTGLLHTPYAMFLRKTMILSIPRCLLTLETRAALDALKSDEVEEVER